MIIALIVEDSLTDRTLLARYLEQIGFRVVNANSSEEAIFAIQEELPDLVFIDIVLPGQSGFEFCRYLKTNKSTQHIPVVICSSKSTEADKLWGSMLGANAYLSKPVNQQAIEQTVKQLALGDTYATY